MVVNTLIRLNDLMLMSKQEFSIAVCLHCYVHVAKNVASSAHSYVNIADKQSTPITEVEWESRMQRFAVVHKLI